MKRSWPTILIVVGLSGLLVLLGTLQYRWLTQINETDGEKAWKAVQEQTQRFAADFNREIQNAYFNLQTDAGAWKKKDWAAFNERYDFWREKAAYPELITDCFFFEADLRSAPLHFERAARVFSTAVLTPELAELRKRFSDEKTFKPVYDDVYALVLPIRDSSPKLDQIFVRTADLHHEMIERKPKTYGFLVIKLNPATIKDQILPDLTAKYFGDGEFRTAVTDADGQAVFQSIQGASSDATATLLELSPENFMFFGNKELLSNLKAKTGGGEKQADVVLNSRVETRSFNRIQTNGNDQGSMTIEVKKGSEPRSAIFTTTTTGLPANGPWNLSVQHSSGSLQTFLAGTLRRNLAIGFGILIMLAVAIAAVIFSAQRVRRLAQRQVDFVSSVSHEFRTPLAVIFSAGENLADGIAKEDGQVSRYGTLIKGEGRKLSAMVEQILAFAGANSGRKIYNFVQIPVSSIIENALAECTPLITEKGVILETDIAPTLPLVNADSHAVSQAIQNLIVNSIKYSGGDKRLVLTAANGGGRVKISVEDYGIGISKSDLKQIFEPFYRSKDVVDAQIHGNGLGLALVKQIAEAHGGRAFAVSEPGKGSKFTIELKSAPPG